MFKLKHRYLFFTIRQNNRFLSTMVHSNKSNLCRIYHHPFNQQLFDGSLSAQIFGRYLRDDYYYLHHFSTILHHLSLKTSPLNSDLSIHLDFMAKDLINSELNMQHQYKEHLQNLPHVQPGRAISSYVDFLSKTIIQFDASIGLSAILPCFWIYHELGKIYSHSAHRHNNPYKRWIDTYSSSDFIRATQQLSQTVISLEERSAPEMQVKMNYAFSSAVQYELDFFDEVYHPENTLQFTT